MRASFGREFWGAQVFVLHADFKVEPEVVEPKVASMERLKRRTDFLAAAKGTRAPAGAFVLQARRRAEDGQEGSKDGGPVRVGFTVSRQVGNAVERNRVRRRLREVVRLAPAPALRAGYDVLIGRRAALEAAFGDMSRQFDAALRRIHASREAGKRNPRQLVAARTRPYIERVRPKSGAMSGMMIGAPSPDRAQKSARTRIRARNGRV